MYFWLKFFHIVAIAVWFTGLFFLPRLFVARHRVEGDANREYFNPVTNILFFRLATPAAVLAIALGMALIAYGPSGAWLAMKLVLVALAVLLHLYFGLLLYELGHGRDRHGPVFYRVAGWVPLLLLLAIAALTAAKPQTVGDLPPPPDAASVP
ncbi:CopD family protein [Luteimonas sp. R10]|uniref:CopD family protein n=1 Tax=Luteimonas sp. R10 TaxID=3108176 RepID=UPI003084ACEE|nr:CopD family protein [Luteimonas sp. R10]